MNYVIANLLRMIEQMNHGLSFNHIKKIGQFADNAKRSDKKELNTKKNGRK